MSLTPYDAIGAGYQVYRRPDARIAAYIDAALGDARSVVNVGAGTGNYEPTDRAVVAIEPSAVMIAQRDPALPPAVIGTAEHLPVVSASADAALAILTMHHWTDAARGLRELARVARRRVVTVTIDPDVEAEMWLYRDYLSRTASHDRRGFPSPARVAAELGPATRTTVVPVPADCTDGFLLSLWSRPEDVLDPRVRAATSGFAQLPPAQEREVVRQLTRDLRSGAWDTAHGHLRAETEFDAGLRLTVTELG